MGGPGSGARELGYALRVRGGRCKCVEAVCVETQVSRVSVLKKEKVEVGGLKLGSARVDRALLRVS